MSKSTTSLDASKIFSASEEEQKQFIEEFYIQEGHSWQTLAELCNTYPNKLRRLAKALGYDSRSRSEAQKNALSMGHAEHPTEGKERPEEVKIKISEQVHEQWKALPDEEKERRQELSKKHWEEMPESKKQDMRTKASKAVRQAAVKGSKLEHYIFNALLAEGFKVQFHKMQMIKNEKLEIDMVLPELNIAIEIDGPNHFEPIWGEKTFNQTKKADNQKDGLLLGLGYTIIRVRTPKSRSEVHKRKVLNNLLDTIKNVNPKKPGVIKI